MHILDILEYTLREEDLSDPFALFNSTEEEEELYSSLYSDVTRKFSTYAHAGTV